jgi:FAD/FMN-containing dehydrogenase
VKLTKRRTAATDRLPLADCLAEHAAKVARIAAAVKSHPPGKPVSLRKRAVSHEVPKPHDKRYSDEKIDVGDLTSIIDIDVERRRCVAESGVTFVDLVTATLERGLTPLVVPELQTITIGGAVSGCSVESSSFRVGGFHDTCLEYEVITGTGEVLLCTPENEHRLLFQMMHGSFGTLGILSRLTFRLAPARRFVRVEYEKHATAEDYLGAIEERFRHQSPEYMDGIVHSPDLYVLSLGSFVDEAPYHNRYDWNLIYWKSTAGRAEDFLRTRDYFFRYDRGVTNRFPRSTVGRLLLGRFLGSTQYLRLAEKLHRFLPDNLPITLDVFVPISRAAEFLAWYRETLGYYPLWCVPYHRVRDYEWIAPGQLAADRLFLDFAIYGAPQLPGKNFHRMMEEKLLELGGIKTLISLNYYGEEEFWTIWNKPNYDAVKSKTDPGNIFRGLYEKTCRAAMGL